MSRFLKDCKSFSEVVGQSPAQVWTESINEAVPLQGRVPSNARYNPLYLAIRLLKRTDTRRVSISALLSQIRPYGAVAP